MVLPAEVLIIGVVALLVFGPKKLPEIGSSLGKSIKGLKEELENTSSEPEKPDN
ncbi:MAG: twin-arginine translocase TatA/TatE family subunit [Cyanobacteria bacterium J083]|nr:MAG: twin-arginine translocase TatA/TatE family subunit [Cyanobacteria bacterium J083]